jgi:threonine dehydrogenase-like Zn-dependent dehydrogenase
MRNVVKENHLSVGYFGIWGNGGYVDASDIVIVFGAGPIGLSALIVAKTARAKVIISEPFKSRRDSALKLDADEVIDPTICDLKDKISRVTDSLRGNVVVESSGNDYAIASFFDVAGHSARVRLIGHSVGRKVPVEIGLTIWKTLAITGSGGIKNFMPRTIKFMERVRNKFDFKALISHRYTFKDIHAAFDKADNDKKNGFKEMLKF